MQFDGTVTRQTACLVGYQQSVMYLQPTVGTECIAAKLNVLSHSSDFGPTAIFHHGRKQEMKTGNQMRLSCVLFSKPLISQSVGFVKGYTIRDQSVLPRGLPPGAKKTKPLDRGGLSLSEKRSWCFFSDALFPLVFPTFPRGCGTGKTKRAVWIWTRIH